MVVRSKEDRNSVFPTFHLSDGSLEMTEELKYLGHVFSNDLKDDSDIRRQCCKIYAQANMLLRKFFMCSVDVKCALLRAYVTPLYTAHLWSSYRKLCPIMYQHVRHYCESLCLISCVVWTCQIIALLRP